MSYTISHDSQSLDLALIHAYLNRESYWAKGISLETVERSIKHSLCFGVYHLESQVGFARVITDYATFGYLADVFILEVHQGKGLGKRLITHILAHPNLQDIRTLMLATEDAQRLYQQFGFEQLPRPNIYMKKKGTKY